jgi:hypothetical protein
MNSVTLSAIPILFLFTAFAATDAVTLVLTSIMWFCFLMGQREGKAAYKEVAVKA